MEEMITYIFNNMKNTEKKFDTIDGNFKIVAACLNKQAKIGGIIAAIMAYGLYKSRRYRKDVTKAMRLMAEEIDALKENKEPNEEASKWPPTCAELSKSEAGAHLHYSYSGDVSEIHYVKVPENHIVIDFDIKDESDTDSFEKNVEEAEETKGE